MSPVELQITSVNHFTFEATTRVQSFRKGSDVKWSLTG